MIDSRYPNRPGKKLIFRRWITSRNGKRIYPPNGRFFAFYVDA